jgi:hypothetical protein
MSRERDETMMMEKKKKKKKRKAMQKYDRTCFSLSFFSLSLFLCSSNKKEETHTQKKCPPLPSPLLYEKFCSMLTTDYDE